MNEERASMRLLRALGDVDDSFIAEALAEADAMAEVPADNGGTDEASPVRLSSRRVRYLRIAGIIAAAVVLIILGAAVLGKNSGWFVGPDGAVAGSEDAEDELTGDSGSVQTGSGGNYYDDGLPDGAPADDGVPTEEGADAADSEGSLDGGDIEAVPAQGSAEGAAQGEDEGAFDELPENSFDMGGDTYRSAADLDEAEGLAGFGINVPAAIGAYTHQTVAVLDGSMIEVSYSVPNESGTGGFTVRKSAGSGDISGLNDDLEAEETVEINGMQVTLRGGEEGWTAAVWENEGYSYALISGAQALSTEEITEMVAQIS